MEPVRAYHLNNSRESSETEGAPGSAFWYLGLGVAVSFRGVSRCRWDSNATMASRTHRNIHGIKKSYRVVNGNLLVGAVGIEPTTFGLKGRCSTTELRPCGHKL